MPADAVTIELVRNALISVTGEMRTKIMRSAFSPIIYESLDFSVAFFNERAETLAQADGLPYFLCDLPNAVRAVIEDVGGAQHMRAGDVFLVNDPYRCSQHPQDVSIVKPAYYRGELFGFTAVRVHLIDLGGKAGFASTDATEIYQEGLVIPTVHLHREGRLNEEIVRLMAANSRTSMSTLLGDLQAQVGACIVGEARLVEVIDRHGYELYRECCDALLVQGETYARAKVREIPDGRYAAELFLDDDGVNRDEPVRIKVILSIEESDMVVDLTGSSGPCAGPYNMNPNYTAAICRIAFKSLTSPHEPSNEGHFRPVRPLIAAQSVFNATRREALAGADYVIVMVMIGGVAPFEVDIEVPARFGVDQTVGDTLGPGGVFRGLRTIPFLIDLCTEMEELCPDALLINYANPMAMNCWAMSAATGIRNVGLCHSVQNTSRQLARYCGIPADEVTYWVAGINHMAWFLEFEHDGRDAYPLLREAADDPAIVAQDPIRFDILRHFDYFVTESSHHMSEYVPYYRKNGDVIAAYIPEKWNYPSFWPAEREASQEAIRRKLSVTDPLEIARSAEYGVQNHSGHGNQHIDSGEWQRVERGPDHESAERVLCRGSVSG